MSGYLPPLLHMSSWRDVRTILPQSGEDLNCSHWTWRQHIPRNVSNHILGRTVLKSADSCRACVTYIVVACKNKDMTAWRNMASLLTAAILLPETPVQPCKCLELRTLSSHTVILLCVDAGHGGMVTDSATVFVTVWTLTDCRASERVSAVRHRRQTAWVTASGNVYTSRDNDVVGTWLLKW
jgi:hypothetical protein